MTTNPKLIDTITIEENPFETETPDEISFYTLNGEEVDPNEAK